MNTRSGLFAFITPKEVGFAFVVLILLGCSNVGVAESEESIIGPTERSIADTPITLGKQNSPTANHTRTATTSRTIAPIRTKAPTQTAITMPSVIDFPDWFSNPSENILIIMETEKKKNQLVFYRAGTEDVFHFSLPDKISRYYWLDNMHLGLISSDRQFTYVADIGSHRVVRESISAEKLILLDRFPDPALTILADRNNPDDYLLAPSDSFQYISMSGKYYLEETSNESYGWQLSIFDPRSNEFIWDISPNSNGGGITFHWSPVNDDQISAVNCAPAGTEEAGLGPDQDICPSISIYDIEKKKMIFTKQGDFGRMDWSPDGTRILYQSLEFALSSLGIPFTGSPCILNITTRQVQCLNKIKTTHITHTYASETTGFYSWGPDNQTVFYTVQFFDDDLLPRGQEGGIRGNLCIYELIQGTIHCPTETVPEMVGNSAYLLSVSPDGQYSHFCLTSAGLMVDFIGEEHEALIKNDGFGFRLLKNNYSNQLYCSSKGLWRPSE